MTIEEAKEFAKKKDFEATIITTKDEGMVRGNYSFWMCANIKEINSAFSVNSWNEDELMKKAELMYRSMQHFLWEDYLIRIPSPTGFKIEYVTEEEFLSN